MGIDIEQDVCVMGHELGTLDALWKAIDLESSLPKEQDASSKQKTDQSSTAQPQALDKKSIKTCKHEFREVVYALWSKFVEVYDAKYADLKASGMSGYCGMPFGRNIYDYELDRYKVYFGFEVCTESIQFTDNQYSLDMKLPENVKEIAKDFIAFNVKFGKDFLLARLTGAAVVAYAIVPEKEATQLLTQSGMEVSASASLHKNVSIC